jgi:hypothetical protein
VCFPAHLPTCWDVRGRIMDALRDVASTIRRAARGRDDPAGGNCWPDWQLSASGLDFRSRLNGVRQQLYDSKRAPVWRGTELWALPAGAPIAVEGRGPSRVPLTSTEIAELRVRAAAPPPPPPPPAERLAGTGAGAEGPAAVE